MSAKFAALFLMRVIYYRRRFGKPEDDEEIPF